MRRTTKSRRVSTAPSMSEALGAFHSQTLPTIWWNEESRRSRTQSVQENFQDAAAVLAAAYLHIRTLENKVAALQGFANAK